MKKIMITTIAAGLIAAVAVAENSTTVTFDFASAYVFRGYTLNDGAVFQPGIEASGLGLPESIGTFTFGAWGNYDIGDYDGTIVNDQFSEVDIYASYTAPIEVVDLSVGVIDYTYPTLGTVQDTEVYASLGYGIAGVGLAGTVYRGVSGDLFGGVTTVELGADYGHDFTDEFSGTVAADVRWVDGTTKGSGWNDGTISAEIAYALSDAWSVHASATYIAQLDDEILPSGYMAYDVEGVGMIGVSSSF